MKALPLIPFSIALLAMIIAAVTGSSHLREMEFAWLLTGVITLLASVLLVVFSKRSIVTVVQVALAATVGQLLLSVIGAAGLMLGNVVADGRTFALWVLGSYWLQLAGLAFIAIKVIRKASPSPVADVTVKSL